LCSGAKLSFVKHIFAKNTFDKRSSSTYNLTYAREKAECFLKRDFASQWVWCRANIGDGKGGIEELHNDINNAIVTAVFTGFEAAGGALPQKDGRMVIGSGETVFNITLENSRNTRYGLQVLGADSGFAKAYEFDGLYHIRLALEQPENGYENIYEKNLDIALRLVPPPGRGQPDDFHLPLVYMLGQIEFLHIIPDADSGPVTKLILVFGADIPGLSVNNIAVKADGADRGHPHSLEHVSEGIYQIGIDAAEATEITVDVAPAGYVRTSKTVAAGGNPGEIKFVCVLAYDSYGTTTKLTLVFDRDIPDLSANDIAIAGQGGGSAATVQGALLEQKAAGVYELAVGVTESETINVTVEKKRVQHRSRIPADGSALCCSGEERDGIWNDSVRRTGAESLGSGSGSNGDGVLVSQRKLHIQGRLSRTGGLQR
jgi:hypothetical protein